MTNREPFPLDVFWRMVEVMREPSEKLYDAWLRWSHKHGPTAKHYAYLKLEAARQEYDRALKEAMKIRDSAQSSTQGENK
jgi:hypothetical protein